MMICPQCNATYTDDYLFCLTGGNALRDESGETPTVASHVSFSPNMTPTEAMTICIACGLANKVNAHFCKKCGEPLASGQAETVYNAAVPPQFGHQQFSPPVFTPPTPGGQQFYTPRKSSDLTRFLIGGGLVLLIVFVGLIAYNAGSGNSASNNTPSSNTDKVANAVNTATKTATNAAKQAANATNAAANAVETSSSSEIGKLGRLDTNLNIRSAANKNAEILGTHYEGAKLRILDSESYTADDGEFVTWYKVRVIEDGYDYKTGNGKGNNWERYGNFGWMEAQREGWMNARYITLD